MKGEPQNPRAKPPGQVAWNQSRSRC
jgi:hypothetical protein